jgi:hypothetical protein
MFKKLYEIILHHWMFLFILLLWWPVGRFLIGYGQLETNWCYLYFGVPITAIYLAARRRETSVEFYANALSFMLVVWVPTWVIKYLVLCGVVSLQQAWQPEMVIHVATIGISCAQVVVWFFVAHVIDSLHGTKRNWWHVGFSIIYVVVSFGAILHALWMRKEFFSPEAYENHRNFSWIVPPTVNAPINWWRIALGFLSIPSILVPTGKKLNE